MPLMLQGTWGYRRIVAAFGPGILTEKGKSAFQPCCCCCSVGGCEAGTIGLNMLWLEGVLLSPGKEAVLSQCAYAALDHHNEEPVQTIAASHLCNVYVLCCSVTLHVLNLLPCLQTTHKALLLPLLLLPPLLSHVTAAAAMQAQGT
jgi:hypothetical protein